MGVIAVPAAACAALVERLPADSKPVYRQGWLEVPGLSDQDLAAILATIDVAAEERTELLGFLAHRRWQAEVGGTTWNGWGLPTDDRSQAKYMAELAAVNEGVRQDGQPWKFAHGFEPLSNTQVRTMAIAARDHVLACFVKEAEVAAAIAAGTVTSEAEIDAAFAALGGPS